MQKLKIEKAPRVSLCSHCFYEILSREGNPRCLFCSVVHYHSCKRYVKREAFKLVATWKPLPLLTQQSTS